MLGDAEINLRVEMDNTEAAEKTKSSKPVIFCRFQYGKKISISTVDNSLCSHFLLTDISLFSNTENKTQLCFAKQCKLMASVEVTADLIANSTLNLNQTVQWILKQHFQGLDFRIHLESYSEKQNSMLIEFIQALNLELKRIVTDSVVSLTVISSKLESNFLNNSLLQKAESKIDYISLVPTTSLKHWVISNYTKSMKTEFLKKITGMDIPNKKILLSINLNEILEQVDFSNFTKSPYKVCEFAIVMKDFNKNSSYISNSLNISESLKTVNNIKEQIKYLNRHGMAGVDVWSLNDDDLHNVCGLGPLPLTDFIHSEIWKKDFTSDAYTDLDITLLAGESQLVEEFQVGDEDNAVPESTTNFKCERIGFFRHPTDCTKFYHCAEHPATQQPQRKHSVFIYKCPRGLVYDEVKESCNWPSYSEPCQGSDEILPVSPNRFQCSAPGFHVDPHDCRWFYYCSDLGDGQLVAFEFVCPSNRLGFDEQTLLCNWRWLVPTCNDSDVSDARSSENFTFGEISVHELTGRNHISTVPITGTLNPLSITDPNSSNSFFHQKNAKPIQIQELNVKTYGSFEVGKKSQTVDPFLLSAIFNNSNSTNTKIQVNHEVKSADRIGKILEDGKTFEMNFPKEIKNNNYSDRKYATAQWRRSSQNRDSQSAKLQDRLDILNERLKNFLNNSSRSQEPSTKQQRNKESEDHKFGIGTVKRVNLKNYRELDSNDDNNYRNDGHPVPLFDNNFQGKSVSKVIEPTFKPSSPVNKPYNSGSPYVNIKCLKLRSQNEKSNENPLSDFGCLGEVSLKVSMNGKENFDKYVIHTEEKTPEPLKDTKNPRYYESVDYNLRFQNYQDDGKFSQDINNPNSRITTTHSYKPETSQKSIERQVNNPIYMSLVLNPVNKLREREYEETTDGIISTAKSTLNNMNNNQNFDNKTTKVEDHMMSISFYPQGVLLNIDINSLNEIPPPALIEVDKMLKKYMISGKINISLLMQKMNATYEPMNKRKSNNGTESQIATMINMLEDIINSTNTADGSRKENFSTDGVLNGNVTRQFEFPEDKTNNASEGTETSNQNLPIIDEAEKIRHVIPTTINDAFARNRLLRKFRFPTIREQLERQKFLSNRNDDGKYPYAVTATAPYMYKNLEERQYLNGRSVGSVDAQNHADEYSSNYFLQQPRDRSNPEVYKSINYPTNINKVKNANFNNGDSLSEDNRNENRRNGIGDNLGYKVKFDDENDFPLRSALSNVNNFTENRFHYTFPLQPTPDSSRRSPPFTQTVEDNLSLPRNDFSDHHQHDTRFSVQNSNDYSRRNIQMPEIRQISGIPQFHSQARKVQSHEDDTKSQFGLRIHPHEENLARYNPSSSPVDDPFRTYYENTPTNELNLHYANGNTRVPLQNVEYQIHPPLNLEDPTYNSNNPNSERSSNTKPHPVRNTLRPKRRKKLRILVKKRSGSHSNRGLSEDHSIPSISYDPNTKLTIPANLISDIQEKVIRKLSVNRRNDIDLQIRYQDQVWNIPFVNPVNGMDVSLSACTRPGLFRHPKDLNMFYECFWDRWLQKYTLHVFSCPVKLVYDDSVRGCNHPNSNTNI